MKRGGGDKGRTWGEGLGQMMFTERMEGEEGEKGEGRSVGKTHSQKFDKLFFSQEIINVFFFFIPLKQLLSYSFIFFFIPVIFFQILRDTCE